MALFNTKPTFNAYFGRTFDSTGPEYNLSALVHPKQGLTSKDYIQLAHDYVRLDDLREGEVHTAIVAMAMNRNDRWLIVPTEDGVVAVPESGDGVWWDENLTQRVTKYFPDDRAELELLVKLAIVTDAKLSNLIYYLAKCDEYPRSVYMANSEMIHRIAKLLAGENLINELR